MSFGHGTFRPDTPVSPHHRGAARTAPPGWKLAPLRPVFEKTSRSNSNRLAGIQPHRHLERLHVTGAVLVCDHCQSRRAEFMPDPVPKIPDYHPFDGGKAIDRVGAVRSAMPGIGLARQRPRSGALPHRRPGCLARLPRCRLLAVPTHRGATCALHAGQTARSNG